MKAVPLSVGFYADEDKSWADQDCLNLLPVKAEQPGGRSDLKLAPLAGLQEFASFPDASRQRGGHVVEGRQFMVIDQSLCQLLPSGAIQILGTIPGTSRCAFAHNQITNGNQLFIATGTSAYVWNTVTSTLVQVTDTGFMGGLLAKFLGSRFITVDPARRFFQWSDLADGTEWNSSNFDAGESSPDRIRSIDVMGDDLVLLNERTIDFFAYTGTTNATFERRPNSLDRGCAASHATVKVDNALFFIGNDGSGYLLRGYQLQRITTHPIEQQWAECDLTKAYAFLHEFEGHKIVYVVMPDGLTWGYDVATGLWHRRGSYGMDRWRLAWLTPWNGGYYGGEFNSGRVFRLNKLYPLEGSACIERAFSPGCLHKGGNRTTLDALRLIVNRGPNVDATAVLPLVFDTEQDEVDGLTVGGDLPPGYVGEVVNFQYRTIGGVSPVSFAVTAGTLPAGVALNPVTGAITGTYTTAADYSWTVTATDADGTTAVLADVNYVIDQTGNPPDSDISSAYSYALTAVNTETPHVFTLATGSLPPGLTLGTDGVISGTTGATEAEYDFAVTLTDVNGVATTKAYDILIEHVSAPRFISAPYGAENILISDDGGVTWEARNGVSPSDSLKFCAAHGQTVVATSSSGYMWRSTDKGETWTRCTSSGSFVTNDPSEIAWQNDRFVCLASGTTNGATIVSTDDGLTWTFYDDCIAFTVPNYLIAGENLFVATGGNTDQGIYTSPDGVTWTLRQSGAYIGVAFDGSMFLAGGSGSGSFRNSVDAITWSAIGGTGFSGVAYSIVAGNGSFTVGTAGNGFYRTTDNGANFTQVSATPGSWFHALSSPEALMLGGSGGGAAMISFNDGATWAATSTALLADGFCWVDDA